MDQRCRPEDGVVPPHRRHNLFNLGRSASRMGAADLGVEKSRVQQLSRDDLAAPDATIECTSRFRFTDDWISGSINNPKLRGSDLSVVVALSRP
jgi:hypothetical protein